MRGVIFCLIIGAGALWAGGQELYTCLKNPKPVEMDVKSYLAAKPDVEWLLLKDASLNLLECAFTHSPAGSIQEVFIPVRAAGEKPGGPVQLLLATKDESISTAAQALHQAGENEQAITRAVQAYQAVIFMQRPVSGLVKFGINSDDKTRGKLEALNLNLAPGYIMIESDAKPEIFKACWGLGIGVIALGGMVGLIRKRKSA